MPAGVEPWGAHTPPVSPAGLQASLHSSAWQSQGARSLGTVLPGAGGVALLSPALEPWGVVLALSKPCFPHQLDSDSSTYGNCKLKVCSPQIIMMMMMIIKGQKRTLEDFYGLDCSDSFPDVYVSPNS